MRSHYLARITNSAGALVSNAVINLYQPGTTTPIATPVYDAPSGGSTVSFPLLLPTGQINLYTDVQTRVRVGVVVGTNPEFYVSDVDFLVPTEDRLGPLEGRATADEANIASLTTTTNNLSTRVSALEASSGGGGGSLGQFGMVALDSFSGANDDARMANALTYIRAQTYKPTLVLSNRQYVFANSYPLDIKGFRMSGPLGGQEREFASQCEVKVNGASLFSVDAAADGTNGTKDYAIRGICFTGNGSNNWLATVSDLAAGPILVDCTISDGGWKNFATVMQARHLRVSIENMYCNNGTNTQFYLAGSDNNYWVRSHGFLSATAMTASQYYIRFSHMSRTTLGAVYITPQTASALRIDGSYGDLYVMRTKFDNTGRNTAGTQTNGPAILITGGAGISIVECEFFNTAQLGAGTKGIVQITGGADHLVSNCTFIGGAAQTSTTPTTRPAVYTTVSCKVRGLTAPQGHQKILQQATSGLINNDDTTWTINTAA